MKKTKFLAQKCCTSTETESFFSGVIGFWHCVLCCVSLFSDDVFFNFIPVEFIKFYVMCQQLVWLNFLWKPCDVSQVSVCWILFFFLPMFWGKKHNQPSTCTSTQCNYGLWESFQSWFEPLTFCVINHNEFNLVWDPKEKKICIYISRLFKIEVRMLNLPKPEGTQTI